VLQLRRRMERGPDGKVADWPLVKKAIEVTLRGEEAALGLDSDDRENARLPAYSEQVRPWVRDRVLKADEQRQWGVDRLFGSADARKEAEEFFNKADELYRQAQAKALKVRAALEVRDRALAQLPYYAHWRSGQAFTEADEKLAADLVAPKSELWE